MVGGRFALIRFPRTPKAANICVRGDFCPDVISLPDDFYSTKIVIFSENLIPKLQSLSVTSLENLEFGDLFHMS